MRWFDACGESAPGGANYALGVLVQILDFAVARDHTHIENNPAPGVKRNRRDFLTRFLSTDEIQRLNRALDRHVRKRPAAMQQSDIVRLLLLTVAA